LYVFCHFTVFLSKSLSTFESLGGAGAALFTGAGAGFWGVLPGVATGLVVVAGGFAGTFAGGAAGFWASTTARLTERKSADSSNRLLVNMFIINRFSRL
jgi:hypothetical protein